MTQADRIREFVLQRRLVPARSAGRTEVTVRAGDVHRDMRLSSAMPAVCSALGGRKFEEYAKVRLRDRSGPENGANV